MNSLRRIKPGIMELRRGNVCPGAAERAGVFGHTLEKERGDRDNKKLHL